MTRWKNLHNARVPGTRVRLHRLKGTRSDEYAVDLVHPFRLIIKPIIKENADLNKLEAIDIVRIEEVTDYHGKQKR